jgi:hypothetical protein
MGFRTWIVPAVALALALGVSACYEDYNLGYEDYDTALTLYNKEVSFAKFKYFVMRDTIVHVYDTTKSDPLTSMRKYDKQILSLVSSNFIARGYERLADTSQITIRGIDRDSVFAVAIGQFAMEYTGYYYDYWYGWYGWYYPYYPPVYGGTYEYSTGTTLIDMVDYGQTISEQKIRSVWSGSVTGLAGDTQASVQTRLSNNINQLFIQSPYLYAGQ